MMMTGEIEAKMKQYHVLLFTVVSVSLNILQWLHVCAEERIYLDDINQTLNLEGNCYRYTSCTGRTRYCKCDDLCGYFGDCCWDSTTSQHTAFHDTYLSFVENIRCMNLPGIGELLVVGDCPIGTKEKLRERCNSPPEESQFIPAEYVIPVIDPAGFVYRNRFCALCNDVNESVMQVAIVKEHCNYVCNNLHMTLEYGHMVNTRSEHCVLRTTLPLESHVRPCEKNVVRTCSHSYVGDEGRSRCKRYSMPVATGGVDYKSPYCALCNDASPVDPMTCRPDIAAAIGSLWTIPERPPPWRLLDTPEAITPRSSTPFGATGDEIKLRQCPCDKRSEKVIVMEIGNSSFCPYFVTRMANCVLNKMEILLRPFRYDIQLPWQLLNNIPKDVPMYNKEFLYFLSLEELPGIYLMLFDWVAQCGVIDSQVWHVCHMIFNKNASLDCEQRYSFSAKELIARMDHNEQLQIRHPETTEVVNNLAWFAFVYHKVHGVPFLLPKGTELCVNARYSEVSIPMLTYNSTFSSTEVPQHSLLETIVSNFCVAISVISLTITFFTYCIFRELRSSFGFTLMNFVAALAIAQILIQFVADYVTEWNFTCHAVAFATHFFWLATFAWMNLLAWNLKLTFSNQKLRTTGHFSGSQRRLFVCYGWLLPLSVVCLCGLLYVLPLDVPVTYGYVREYATCWIGNRWVAFSVVGVPLILVIIMNGVLFGLTLQGIQRNRFKPDTKSTSQVNHNIRKWDVVIYIKISVLMGFTWAVGFLVKFDPTRTIFYVNCIAYALQGFLVMVFFVLNKRVSSLIVKKFRQSNSLRSTKSTRDV